MNINSAFSLNRWFFEPDQWVEVVDPYATDVDNPSPERRGNPNQRR